MVMSNCMDCPECRSPDIVTDFSAGDVVCRNCGFVCVTHIIDDSQEWRTYTDPESERRDASRIGRPEDSLQGNTLSTEIQDAGGKDSGAGDRRGLNKLHKRTTANAKDIAFLKHLKEIAHVCERLSLPNSVLSIAAETYSQAQKCLKIKNKDRETFVAATVYIACRQAGVPRSLKEVASAGGVARRDLGKVYLSLSKGLSLNLSAVESVDYMSRFCSKLSLSMEVQKVANKIAAKASEGELVGGRAPATVAAAAIFLVANMLDSKRHISDVAKVAMVGEQAIRSTCKSLVGHLAEIAPQDLKDKADASSLEGLAF